MSINLNTNPYYDDFDQSKNYVRILFKPGVSVQARELTQIQTSLQNQIAKFGNHIFQDGAVVQGGSTSFVDVNSLDVAIAPGELGAINGYRIRGNLSDAQGVVVKTTNLTSSTVRIYYTKTNSKNFNQTDLIEIVETNDTLELVNTDSLESSARMFSVGESVFFVNNAFVYCEPQNIILPSDFAQTSLRVGLDVKEFIASANDDETLLDPAQGSYNFAAPGADRYGISLTLNSYYFDPREEVGNTGDFIELSRFVNGRLVSKLTSTMYSEIEKTLARRTSDESGDYTVRKFLVDVTENIYGEKDKLTLVVSPGKAYVKGYEFETTVATDIDLPRARDTKYVDGTQLSAEVGNRFFISEVSGSIDYNNKEVNILDSNDVVIGSLVIKGIYSTFTPSSFELSVYGLQLNAGYAQSDIAKLASDGWQATVESFNIISARNKNIVQFQNKGIKTLLKDGVSDTQFVVSKVFSTIFSEGVAVIATPPDEFLLSNSPEDYVAIDNSGNFLKIGSISGTATSKEITLSDSSLTSSAKIYTNIGVSNAMHKTKTKTTVTARLTVDPTQRVFDIGYSDIIEVTSAVVSNSSSSGETLEFIRNFEVSNGQTEYLYDHGTLTLVEGVSLPDNFDTIDVTFSYYSHSTAGYFFSVDSYPETTFREYPVVIDNRGVAMNMRDCMDFRPIRAQGVGNKNIVSNGVVASDTIVSVDYEYYLKRNDILVITSEKKLSLIKGISSETPEFPATPSDSMLIYRIELEEYTQSPAEVSLTFIDNRRYTMRDIAEFDRRIKRVEYFTSLSLLEKSAADAIISSSVDGIDRFKNGILVDSFAGHDVGDTSSTEYRCSVDTQTQTLRPKTKSLGYNAIVSVTSGAVTAGTDNSAYTVPFTDEVQQFNGFATNWVNVNPYNIFTWNGTVRLSPDADKWADTSRLPVDNNKTKFTDVNSFWEWWKDYENTSTGYTPWVRSKVISFVAQMLRPDSILDATLDGVNITPYCYAATRVVCNKPLPTNAVRIVNGEKTAEILHANDNTAWIAYGENSEKFSDSDSINVIVKTGETETTQSGGSIIEISTSENLQVDYRGDLVGFFVIPSDTNAFSFRAGSLKFTLTDDPSSRAPSTYAETSYIAFSDIAGDGPKPAPTPPTIKEVGCNTDISESKPGVFEYQYNFENTDTIIGVNVISVSSQTDSRTPPVKISIIWKDRAVSTGFFGNTYYENSLSALGYPGIIKSSVNNLTLRRNADAPARAIIRVEAPIEGTVWKIRTTCSVAPALDPRYSISSNTQTVSNGESFVYTVDTSDVDPGTTLYWVRDPSSTLAVSDISPSVGEITVGSTGRATFSVNVSSNAVPLGGAENLLVNLRTGSQSGPIVASKNTSVVIPLPPSYDIVATSAEISNDSTVTFNVSATNVSNGTILHWVRDASSTILESDIDKSSGVITLDSNGRYSFSIKTSPNAVSAGSTKRLKINLLNSSKTQTLDSEFVAVYQTPSPTYAISSSSQSVGNGSTITFNVTTSGVANGTVLNWSRDSSSTLAAGDINVTSGTVTINNGAGTFSVIVGANAVQAGSSEILKINLLNSSNTQILGSSSVSVTEVTEEELRVYRISATPVVVENGGTVTFNVTTSGVANGTVLNWSRDSSSTLAADDISSSSGTVTINNGSGSFTITLGANAVTAGTAESLKINVLFSGNIVASYKVSAKSSYNPTYTIKSTPTLVGNGDTITYNITTSGVASGTSLLWRRDTSSTLSVEDISRSVGVVTINDGAGSFTVKVSANAVPAGSTETLKMNLFTDYPGETLVASTTTSVSATSAEIGTVAVSLYDATKTFRQGDTANYWFNFTLANYKNPPAEVDFQWNITPISGCSVSDFVVGGLSGKAKPTADSPLNNATTKIYSFFATVQIKDTAPVGGKFKVSVTAFGKTNHSAEIVIKEKAPAIDWQNVGALIQRADDSWKTKSVIFNGHSPIMAETKSLGTFAIRWFHSNVETSKAKWRVTSIRAIGATLHSGFNYDIAGNQFINPIEINADNIRLRPGTALSETYKPSVYGSTISPGLEDTSDIGKSITKFNETVVTKPDGSSSVVYFNSPDKLPVEEYEGAFKYSTDSSYLLSWNTWGSYFSIYLNPYGGLKTGTSYTQTTVPQPIPQKNLRIDLEFTIQYESGDDTIPQNLRTKVVRTYVDSQIGFYKTTARPYDPVAQTFYVDGSDYPEGVFVNAVDLFFRNKSSSSPIRIELRNVINGYPADLTKPILAKSILPASKILVSTDASVATRFDFERITHLTPGEYAFVVVSDSTEYELFSSVLGEITVDKNQRVTSQPTLGSMFKSQNAGTWTAVQEEDLKFTLYRCNFEINKPVSLTLKPVIKKEDGTINVDSVFVDSGTKMFSTSEVASDLSINGKSAFAYQMNATKTLASREVIDVDASDKMSLSMTLKTTSNAVAPVIDVNKAIFTLTENLISDDFTNEENPIDGSALAKYVTRKVKLTEGFEASDIQVLLSAKLPTGTSIKIYYKVAAPADTVFIDNDYHEMVFDSKSSKNNTGFVEHKYKTEGTALPNGEKFDTFAIKIVMLSNNPVVYPELKDLRILALD